MPPRRQPRRVARELALLSLSQMSSRSEAKLAKEDLQNLVLAAIRTLSSEMQELLETAAGEARRSSDRLLNSETSATDLKSAKAMVREALELTQVAINRLGVAVEMPEFVQMANQQEVRDYTLELIGTVKRRRLEIDQQLENALVDWQLNRLARVDRDILRLATAEMLYLDIPNKVAINEAVELAKQYSDQEGTRFINGVLRRVTERMKSHS